MLSASTKSTSSLLKNHKILSWSILPANMGIVSEYGMSGTHSSSLATTSRSSVFLSSLQPTMNVPSEIAISPLAICSAVYRSPSIVTVLSPPSSPMVPPVGTPGATVSPLLQQQIALASDLSTLALPNHWERRNAWVLSQNGYGIANPQTQISRYVTA
uniref:Uncharacterized protein n=2 Tax=Prorocentrum micans TaxID=2945 RepID=A0A7S2TB90_PROMC|mmetsp:Transcript_11376/g.8986  ORF Transcript_11376/g.8986 Transcript_11376/m.8986 type:complete len:158 (+) Transcript_11376:156-629(+)